MHAKYKALVASSTRIALALDAKKAYTQAVKTPACTLDSLGSLPYPAYVSAAGLSLGSSSFGRWMVQLILMP